jgi:hypothetical protein
MDIKPSLPARRKLLIAPPSWAGDAVVEYNFVDGLGWLVTGGRRMQNRPTELIEKRLSWLTSWPKSTPLNFNSARTGYCDSGALSEDRRYRAFAWCAEQLGRLLPVDEQHRAPGKTAASFFTPPASRWPAGKAEIKQLLSPTGPPVSPDLAAGADQTAAPKKWPPSTQCCCSLPNSPRAQAVDQ